MDAEELMGRIVKLRASRLLSVLAITLAGVVGFTYAMHGLSLEFGKVWPAAERGAMLTDIDDVRRAEYDDVPPAAGDPMTEARFRAASPDRAIKRAMLKAQAAYVPYNLAAARVAEANEMPDMADEVARDGRMYDPAHDAWSPVVPDGGGRKAVHFSTFNTLGNI
jgi:hypothetical protein